MLDPRIILAAVVVSWTSALTYAWWRPRRWLAGSAGAFDTGTVERDRSYWMGPRLVANYHGMLAIAGGLIPEIELRFPAAGAPNFSCEIRRKPKARSSAWVVGLWAILVAFAVLVWWGVLGPNIALALVPLGLFLPRTPRFNASPRAPMALAGGDGLEFSTYAPDAVQRTAERPEVRALLLRLFGEGGVGYLSVSGGAGQALRLRASLVSPRPGAEGFANTLAGLEQLGKAITA